MTLPSAFLLVDSFDSSIRAMCGVDLEKNCVHGSDSRQSAQREIAFFFKEAPSGQLLFPFSSQCNDGIIT